MYNLSIIKNMSSFMAIPDYVQQITYNKFFGIILIGIYFVFLLVLRKQGIETAIMVSSYLCLILSVTLNFIGYVSFYYVLFFLSITAFSTMYAYIVRQPN